MKRIFIDAAGVETRVAIQEDGRLAEYHVEPADALPLVGSVFRGRVVNVLPGLQAAFVDIGLGENAYLYIDDALPADWQGDKKNIRQWVKEGEIRLVQVTKEAIGDKAPRVTTRVSLPGRRVVYLPDGNTVSVSRRIRDERERTRLLQAAKRQLFDQEGAILRTLAEGADEQDLAAELAYLRSLWREASRRAKEGKGPALVHRDADLAVRVVRDAFAEDVDELIVEGGDAYRRVREAVAALHPGLAGRIKLHRGREPLFAAYGLEAELDKALARRVWLDSGGFLVIDQTEALTVIDVNTGRYTGKGAAELEETANRTNLEAAREIARQLRLRNIGGIIIIDFIDVESEESRARIAAALEQELRRDRTAAYVVGWTKLGLVEMTRKKVRPSLTETLTRPCPVCAGRGRVISEREAVNRLEREVRGLASSGEVEAVAVEAHPGVAEALREGPKLRVPVYVRPRQEMLPGTYRIVYAGSEDIASRRDLD